MHRQFGNNLDLDIMGIISKVDILREVYKSNQILETREITKK